jgi:hypothetical protein
MGDSEKSYWTKKRPTEPGMYWMAFPVANVQLAVVLAQIFDGPQSLLVAFPGDEKISTPGRYDDCMWSGPISKPKVPKITIDRFKSLGAEDMVAITF